MIKLVDLLKEIQCEQQQIADFEKILGRPLTESEMNELDLKRTAKNLAVGAALGAATMFGSPKASAQTQPHPTTAVSTSNKALENKIKNVLVNGKTTHNSGLYKVWVGIGEEIEIYLYKNGDMEIFKDKWEEGKWKLNGNKLTIINTDSNTTETFPVKIIDKETIMIGNIKFYFDSNYEK